MSPLTRGVPAFASAGSRLEMMVAATTSLDTALTDATCPVGRALAARSAAARTCGTRPSASPGEPLTTIENEPSGFWPK